MNLRILVSLLTLFTAAQATSPTCFSRFASSSAGASSSFCIRFRLGLTLPYAPPVSLPRRAFSLASGSSCTGSRPLLTSPRYVLCPVYPSTATLTLSTFSPGLACYRRRQHRGRLFAARVPPVCPCRGSDLRDLHAAIH